MKTSKNNSKIIDRILLALIATSVTVVVILMMMLANIIENTFDKF